MRRTATFTSKQLLFIAVSVCYSTLLSGQSIDSMLQIAEEVSQTSPDSARSIYEVCLEEAQNEEYRNVAIRSMIGIGRSHYAQGSISEALVWVNKADSAVGAVDEKEWELNERELLSTIHFSQLTYLIAIGRYPEAQELVEEELNYLVEADDTSQLIDLHCHAARLQSKMGEFEDAMNSIFEAQQLQESLKDPSSQAFIYTSRASIYDEIGDARNAIRYFKRAVDIYDDLSNYGMLLPIYTNMSFLYSKINEQDSAVRYLDLKADLLGRYSSKIGLQSTLNNKILLLIQTGRFREANITAKSAIDLWDSLGLNPMHTIYLFGVSYRGMNRYDLAAPEIERAFNMAVEIGNYGGAAFYSHALYQTYFWKDRYEPALTWYQQHISYRDSVYSERQRNELAVLEARFDASQKEQEVYRLTKEKELDTLRKNRLWLSLGLLFVLAVFIIVTLYLRSQKRAARWAMEKAEKEAKNQKLITEQNELRHRLESKRRELTSTTLHLAKKNEALAGIKYEVESRFEGQSGLHKVSRLIEGEINSEEEWNRFIITFRDMHAGFYNALHEKVVDITPAESKLACLIRMNLSSKEIAQLLNITQAGIKKGRYRLRKKLDLDSSEDLYGYLVSLG